MRVLSMTIPTPEERKLAEEIVRIAWQGKLLVVSEKENYDLLQQKLSRVVEALALALATQREKLEKEAQEKVGYIIKTLEGHKLDGRFDAGYHIGFRMATKIAVMAAYGSKEDDAIAAARSAQDTKGEGV